MMNLIKKEFLIQKKYFLYFLPYSLFMLIIFSSSSQEMAQSAYMVAAVGVTYMFIQYSCAIEDQNKSERILNSLPISRKKIVLSKYGSIILFSILSASVLGLLGTLALNLTPINIRKMALEDIIGIFSVTWILAAIYLPVYFKFGYIKAKVFNMIMFFIFFFGPIMTINYLKKHTDNPLLKFIKDFITSMGSSLSGGIVVATAIVFVGISAIISIKIYYNREFN